MQHYAAVCNLYNLCEIFFKIVLLILFWIWYSLKYFGVEDEAIEKQMP